MQKRLKNTLLQFSVLFSLILSLVLGIRQVSAQDPTPTPWSYGGSSCDDPDTPIHEMCEEEDWEPLFKSPTPYPTDYFGCPEEGEMEGLGTVTPAVVWLMECGLCINDQTPQPTEFIEPSPTWDSSEPTPVPTGTPVPTITPGPEYYLSDVVASCTKTDPGGHYGDWYCGTSFTAEEDVYGVITEFTDGGSGREDVDLRHALGNWSYGARLNDFSVISPVCYEKQSGYCSGVGFSGTIKNLNHPTAKIWSAGATRSLGGWYQWGNTSSSGSWTYDVKLIYYGIPPEEPEPTPIPTGTPYPSVCDSIIGNDADGNWYGGGGPEEIEDYFKIPVPLIGIGQCMTMMPEFSIPTTALNVIPGITFANDLAWPGLTVCLKPITLGQLKILDMSIDLDFYGALIAGIMMLRKLLRS